MGNSGEGDGHWLTGGWLEWFSEGGWLGFESCSRVVAVGRSAVMMAIAGGNYLEEKRRDEVTKLWNWWG